MNIAMYLTFSKLRGFEVMIYEVAGGLLHWFSVEPHEVPAVALTIMEIQIQEQDA